MPAKLHLPDKICLNCEKVFNRTVWPSGQAESRKEYDKRRFCCHKCYTDWHVGPNHVNYKDGFRRGHNWGYLRVSSGKFYHRVVMEQHLGRPLTPDEHVHHIDGNVLNNAIENLTITTNSQHRKLHAATQNRGADGRFA